MRVLLAAGLLLASAAARAVEIADVPEPMGDMIIAPGSIQPADKGAVLLRVELWEDGVLPLVFAPGFNRADKDAVFSACAEWEKAANVRCVIGPYKGRSLFVENLASGGCFCLWGMGTHFIALRRLMNLGRGCMSRATIIHELGHAFGLIHEHQRPDRDRYVTIQGENIQDGFFWLQQKVNFNRQDAVLSTPYDFRSIMHYGRRAFSRNGFDTIVPAPQYSKFINVMGGAEAVSPGDAATLAAFYGK